MFPIQSLIERVEEILAELDALAEALDGEDADDVEELNAELEDALLLLCELKPQDEDFDDDLADALEELRALAGDYRALSRRVPGVAGPARRLELAAGT